MKEESEMTMVGNAIRRLAQKAPRRDPAPRAAVTHERNCPVFLHDGSPCGVNTFGEDFCLAHEKEPHGEGRETAAPAGYSRRGAERVKVPQGRAAQGAEQMGDLVMVQDWVLREDMDDVDMGFTRDSGELRRRADFLAAASLEESTRKMYRAWWATWVSYLGNSERWQHAVTVDEEGVTEVNMPIDPEAVREYVAFLAGLYAHGTIETAMAAISAVCKDLGYKTPTKDKRVTDVMHGYEKRQKQVNKKLFVLLPAMVRGCLKLKEVREDSKDPSMFDGTCEGTRWSRARLLRAQVGMGVAYICFARKIEVQTMDRCDFERDEKEGGYNVNIWGGKTDKISAGRTTVIGGDEGDEAGFIDLVEEYLTVVGLEDDACDECTKRENAKERCVPCGFMFPALDGKGKAVKKAASKKKTTDFFTKDARQMLKQLKENQGNEDGCMDGVNPTKFTWIACRRGGNSAACAEQVAADHRRIHGRWKSSSCPDNEYLRMHRSEFAGIASTVLLSQYGSSSGSGSRAHGGGGSSSSSSRAQGDNGRGASDDSAGPARQRRRRHRLMTME